MKVYDLEHHFYAKEVIEFLKSRKDYPYCTQDGDIFYRENALLPMSAPGINSEHKAIEELVDVDDVRLGIMDKSGITHGVISTSGLIEELPKEEAVKYAKLTNDRVAELCKKYPDRFLGTICLPTPYIAESIEELERAVKVLGLKFWHTHSNYGNQYLYEEKFEPILAKCAELGIAFYLHPHNPSTPFLLDSGVAFSSAGFGFGVDTMKTSIKLILNGIFDRYPNLKMILGHMAEFYPYCLDRMDNRFFIYRDKGFDPTIKCKGTFTDYFKNKNIFMTTSGIYDPNVVICAMNTVGIDNILFGSDYPYEDIKGSVDFIKNLPINEEDKEKIFYKNAEKYILNIK